MRWQDNEGQRGLHPTPGMIGVKPLAGHSQQKFQRAGH
jgi:hypothetical protein